MLFPKIPSNFFFKQSTKNNANIPKNYHNTLTKNYLNRKNEKIILSKSIAFALSSPIDTVRQNILTKNTIKPSRIIKSIPHGFIASFLISLPCHTTINILENTIDNEIFAIILGVLVANTIKIPIIYNYKKVQTGMQVINKNKKLKSISNIIKISACEDIIEESIKYNFAKQKLSDSKTQNTIFTNDYFQSLILFSIVYPFDILKNKGFYNMSKIKASKYDFCMKATHKNLQNILLFQILRILK